MKCVCVCVVVVNRAGSQGICNPLGDGFPSKFADYRKLYSIMGVKVTLYLWYLPLFIKFLHLSIYIYF